MAPGQVCAQHDTTAAKQTPSITTMGGQITRTHVAFETAHRRSIAARTCATTHPIQDRPVPHWLSSEPRLEQHESLRNVATGCHFVPRKKHVAETQKPDSPCTCARNFRLRRGPGQHAKKHTPCTVGCTVGKRVQVKSAAHANRRRAVDRAIGRMAGRATGPSQIAGLARNAASEPIRMTALLAKLKSAIRVFRIQSVKPSCQLWMKRRSFTRYDYVD